MRNVTLQQLRLDIQNQADVAGLSARHGATLIDRRINQSIQRFRERLSGEGARHFLAYATGTLQPGATSGFPFRELDAHPVASGLVRVYGLDIKTQGGEWKRLEHTTFEDRANYGGPVSTGEPSVWAEYQTTKLAILPCPDRQFEYLLWYLPALADLVSNGDTFNGVAGWEDFVMWDVVTSLGVRDQSPAYQMFIAERQAAWTDILRNATRVTGAGGATIGRDSMGNKDLSGMRGRRYLPPP